MTGKPDADAIVMASPESSGRQTLAASGSPGADEEVFRGDDALFQAMLNGANVKCAAYLSGLSERTVFRRMADPAFKQRLKNARELVRDSILSYPD